MNDWIEWKGGDCPVAGDVMVETKLRDGGNGSAVAREWEWAHGPSSADIIAYRVIYPEKPAKPCPWQPGNEYKLRGGGTALIYCTDAPGGYPIHGRIQGDQHPQSWNKSGCFIDDGGHHHDLLPPRAERVAYLYRDGQGAFISTGTPDEMMGPCIGSAIVREGEFHDR